jgi:hypothetical protein
LTTDQTVLSWIKGYQIPFDRPPFQLNIPQCKNYSEPDIRMYDNSIEGLLYIGAISKCEPCDDQFVSTIFLVPKPNGRTRLILNLKQLNKFIDAKHFKLEDFRTIIKLVSKDCYMSTIDLKDAYFLIKIHDDSKKYLRFQWKQNLYEFNVLPFGLNTAPYVFTKVMKPVVRLLRYSGLMSTIYLDDLCLLAYTYRDCILNIQVTKKLLCALGFIINETKSCMIPSTSCRFLGFIINSQRMEIQLPLEKRLKIKTELVKFRKLKRCKIRNFARLVGLLISVCPAIEYGWLYTKAFERCKFLNLKNNDNYDRYMNIPPSLYSDFDWWIKSIDKSICKIKFDEYKLEIYSDASTTGWGITCDNETASGIWSQDERNQHINYLELLAAFIGLKIFANNLFNCQLILRIDNMTAISYINRMGGIQFPHLTKLTKDIWQWCEARNIFIYALYIPSVENTIADAESRRVHPDIEWELSHSAFEQIVAKFGTPDIDLFASRINKKCIKYISWHKDPGAYTINAFSVNWQSWYFYCFPPFSMILKTLRKIKSDGATGILVVPNWPSQPWYPLFKKLLVSKPLTFHSSKELIVSHSSHRQIHHQITLVAGLLCGNPY